MMTRPAIGWRLLLLLGEDAERDAAIERDALQLDVEPVAVGVCPGGTDAGPEPFFAVSVFDLIGDVAGAFARTGSGSCCGVGHKMFPSLE